jgi:four helix bundle protein
VANVERFEDLIAWQKARVLAREIYLITRQPIMSKDYGLSGQMQRAAVSVMSNIAEGFERANRNEFHHFLVIAKASCAEIRSQLYLAFDVGYIDEVKFKELKQLTEEVGRIVGGLRASIDRQRRQ